MILLALAALTVSSVNGCDPDGTKQCLVPFTECVIEQATGDPCSCYSSFSGCVINKIKGCSSSAVAQICAPINDGAEKLGCSYRCSGATAASLPAALSLAAAAILARLLL